MRHCVKYPELYEYISKKCEEEKMLSLAGIEKMRPVLKTDDREDRQDREDKKTYSNKHIIRKRRRSIAKLFWFDNLRKMKI